MNPIIWREGVCDPHAHVFNNRVYVYASHDCPYGTDGFRMEDWQIWSSEDLVNWKLEQTIRPDSFYCGRLDQCWAVDAAYRDGTYYWYFSTGDWGVGVGRSDSPAGPFTDALGGPLVDHATEPAGIPKWDPCVFQDDDGSAYLIVGDCRSEGCNAYMIGRLSDDMIHLAEPLRKVEYRGNICPEDKASIHKYNGRYYLTHSSFYAVSDCVYGPYEYVGNTGCNVDHGSYFTYRNQTYFASGGMDNPNRYYRTSFLVPCHYRGNGEIVVDQKIMGYGCGQYDATWKNIMTAWYFEATLECKRERQDGTFVTELRDGESLGFPNIHNVEKDAVLHVRAAASGERAVLTVREKDRKGRILGSCELIPVKGKDSLRDKEAYQEVSCSLENEEGSLSLYFEVSGDTVVYLESFSFEADWERSVAEPSLSLAGRGAVMEPCTESGRGTVLKNLNLKNTFIEAAADGGSGGDGELEIWYQAADGETELALIVNDEESGMVRFPDTNRKVLALTVPVALKAGVNRIRLECRTYQNTYLAIDHLIIARRKETARTYSAAEGQMIPRGNGCWDGLPQRECDPQAFAGRTVKYIETDGHGFVMTGIDGGSGGRADLLFHYAREHKESSRFRLRINGAGQEQILEFGCTGSHELSCGADLEACVELLSGDVNMIELIKVGGKGDITLDAVTVIPQERNF